eukprot:jgi/Astpho2/46/Aster-07498
MPEEQAQPAAAADADSTEGEYTWRIPNFSSSAHLRLNSDQFEVCSKPWKLLVFPRGNRDSNQFISVYLDVADAEMLPDRWHRRASFKLMLVNQRDPARSITKEAAHTFTAQAQDWGFNQFALQNDILDVRNGYLVDDTLVLKVVVKSESDDMMHDSKKETGFVGLKNQGATCYMNSLLQTLYNINYFRQAVYHMPTTEEEQTNKSIPLAMQALFYKLQFGSKSVSTKDLTKSFGWDTVDAFYQHDAQELNRVLCEKLEEKMKNTRVQGAISHLFEGHTQSFVECVNVEYKSARKETYMDLSLDVKGCKNVYDSMEQYTKVELLEGENQYKAEGFGMQDARKGILFEDFPPVLQLQLKRFEYDFQRDININDRYEFPEQLDLDYGDRRFLAQEADQSVRNVYKLHSVLVHSGGVHGGHYYAFIRPDGKQWLKFDDDKVTKANKAQAVDEQYGGEDENAPPAPGLNAPTFKFTKFSNAYCLVYVREAEWSEIMVNVTSTDIAEHVRARLEAEAAEKERKRKEKAEAHLFTIIKLSTRKDMEQQIGTTLFFDLVDQNKVKHYRVKKQTKFQEFRQMLADDLEVPLEQQRFWTWAKRQNSTYRPNNILTPADDEKRVMDLKDGQQRQHAQTNEICLFLETPGTSKPLPDRIAGSIILFFKLYEPTQRKLSFIGHFQAPKQARIRDLHIWMRHLAGFAEDTPVKVWEEVKFEPEVMCEPCEPGLTLAMAQLEDGDILCFQRALTEVESAGLQFPTVKDFLEYTRNRQMLCFHKLEQPKDEGITLELSKLSTYREVCEALADALQLDNPAKLRLTQHNNFSGIPKPMPMKFNFFQQLRAVCDGPGRKWGQEPDVASHSTHVEPMYYEVLDISLQELEQLKTLKVGWHNAKGELVSEHTVRLPRDSTVQQVLDEVKRLANADPQAELRMLEICHNKIFKVFGVEEGIDTINDTYWTLRVEATPTDQLQLMPHDRLIHVYHVTLDTQQHPQTFGDPLFMRISDGETLSDFKPRVQALLGVSDDEFARWKFCFNTSLRPTDYLRDEEVLSDRFPAKAIAKYPCTSDQPFLGLEHRETHRHRQIQRRNVQPHERSIRIYN